ncbi:putative ABC transport system permease protein [Syntrophus gentianae]|uniref:Putative ABC transport system permease protein n=1 Tax=Syntrophus gentianae TaxID=43775 RepID=A0A1H7V416_9BACT|nr:ABC transporter permease [Syntrophus gentianae]SEM03906.1 putative ABC transport system permease protein [Syntrophus gentianae]
MLGNSILLAFREIRRNVLRSFLTILGIVIGVAAVITMVTIGGGATAQVSQQISSLGSNLLMVTPGKRLGPGQSSDTVPFKVSDAEAITRDIRSIAAVAPVSSQSLQAVSGNENWSTNVTGTDNSYFKVTNRSVRTGRTFSETELRSGAAVCVLGETVRKKLFGNQDPVGAKIRLQKLSCKVIGLLETKGQSTMGQDQDDLVVIPLRTLQRRVTGSQNISLIQVSVQDGASTEKVQQDIGKLMRERRHLAADEEDNFNVMDMKEITKMLTGTTQMLTALLSAVAAVSLLVGGIGIMNIMLVSVTERTHEIGIRLAIGALEREVLLQFLVEAVVLSSFGGLLGIVLALAGSLWLSGLLNVPFVFNAGIVVVAFLFSAAVGVIFGYFPALKAARLDPIVALRHE